MRSKSEFENALTLLRQGQSATEVARALQIPRSTVRDWRQGKTHRPRPDECAAHDYATLDGPAYAYLLAMYLGDGCISLHSRRVWKLRVTLDARYPGIIAECAAAIGTAFPGRRVHVYRKRNEGCVEVSNYWKHWPCFFPQHGVGPKHARPICLTTWQQRIVQAHAELFLRGLIHSDGTRIIATERKRRYVRRAPRYCFSNRSEDILEMFRSTCEVVGVHCTRASKKQIAVYSKTAVARLDEFIGPKQ